MKSWTGCFFFDVKVLCINTEKHVKRRDKDLIYTKNTSKKEKQIALKDT